MAPRIAFTRGDIAAVAVDAVVNAANQGLLGGAGVDGAIHRGAGPELFLACRALPEIAPGVRCPTGEVRVTPGFRLPARWILHTVGPVFGRHPDPDAALASCHRACLDAAVGLGARTVAFPAISCGAYGFPRARAAAIAVGVARERAWELDEIRFVLYDEATLEIFRAALPA